MILSKEDLKSFIIGMLLGDGYLHLGKNSINYNIGCTHNPKQYDYMIWKMEILKENLHKNYWTREIDSVFSGKAIFEGNKNKIYKMFHSILGSHTFITNIHKEMYENKKKIVPYSILDQLTPIGISVWFMDDGTLSIRKHKDGRNKTKCIFLHIQGFDSESQLNIQKYFNEKYNFESSLHKDREHLRLYIPARKTEDFLSIVNPYVSLIDCMKYKLNH
jgi:23S rRNA G2445 N2-methylase RlmL